MAKFICNFISYTLKRAVDITVVIPSVTFPQACGDKDENVCMPEDTMQATHDIRHKYPVIYLLHGLGNNHMTWNGYTNVELYAEERNIAVVMLSGENKSYMNQPGDLFYDFVADELQEFVRAMFPVSSRPEDTYIAGLSMGGIGTYIQGLRNPEKYKAMGVFSAGIFLPPVKEWPKEFDPSQLVLKLKSDHQKLPAIFLACGGKDPLFEMCVRTRSVLQECGFSVEWREEAEDAHEWRFWDKMIENFMDWLPRTDAYAIAMRKRNVSRRKI